MKYVNDLQAGELSQWLRALAAPAEDLGLVPKTQAVAHNFLELSCGSRKSSALFWPLQAP